MTSLSFRFSPEAVNYAWRQLAQRAGVTGDDPAGNGFEDLGISVHYARPEQVSSQRPAIVVVPCGDDALQALLERPNNSLTWLPAEQLIPEGGRLPFDDSVPALLWGKGCQDKDAPLAWSDGMLVFYVDIIATVFFMLSRWEETLIQDRDQHGRFPGAASVAYKQSFLDRPIVDEYGLVLRQWLKALLPGWQPKLHTFSVKLSHDVDWVLRFPNWRRAIRAFAGDLLKRRSPKLAWQTGLEAVSQEIAPGRSSYLAGIEFLANLSRDCGLGGDAFYFMAAEPAPLDSGYDPASPLAKTCIEGLRRRGFEIGLHPGYHTFNNLERLAAEKARMDQVLGESSYGGRQHYLRFQVPDTWRHWEQVGLTYDATMTYAQHEGFRCGTCHTFRPFDVQQNRELDVWEQPLIVMDQTLKQYRELLPDQAEARILELARRCQQVEGVFTLLWHNSSLTGEWQPWQKMYKRVIESLVRLKR